MFGQTVRQTCPPSPNTRSTSSTLLRKTRREGEDPVEVRFNVEHAPLG